ncbi:MAG: NAD(P)H-hydrate dehydratase [Bacteroidales bacterium]|nr:NAD(P)H-hydrate dehydratase [Bacteroidales bacterium]
MKNNVFTPQDIDYILEATLGKLDEIEAMPEGAERDEAIRRRVDFITEVGVQVAKEVETFRGESDAKVIVFAGDDINGAYALQTATELHRKGTRALVYLFNIGGNLLTLDTRMARDRFIELVDPAYLVEVIDPGRNFTMPAMNSHMLVVDGIFGREYRKPLKGGYQAVAREINEQHPKVISIDLPSGMDPELTVGMINRNIVHATLTLTLVGPSLAFFMPENNELLGRWKVLKLALNTAALHDVHCTTRVMDMRAMRAVLKPRSHIASKQDLGDCIIFAGSFGMMGSAVLAAQAACRSGCGRVTVHSARCGNTILQTAVPCAMFATDGCETTIERFDNPHRCRGIAIGPGIGTADATIRGLETFLKACTAQNTPVILDADALNCIARNPLILEHVPPRSIITPHAAEFDRIFGSHPTHAARVLKAIAEARRHKIIIVLKGHHTLTIWTDGTILINPTGTEALATAGSGDVLTGLMGGLVAQRMISEIAATVAVFVHGYAGQLAARRYGIFGTTAEDIAECVGEALQTIVYPSKKE